MCSRESLAPLSLAPIKMLFYESLILRPVPRDEIIPRGRVFAYFLKSISQILPSGEEYELISFGKVLSSMTLLLYA